MPSIHQNVDLGAVQTLQDLESHKSGQVRPLRAIVSGQSEFAAEVIRLIARRGHQIVLFICTNRDLGSHDVAEKAATEMGVPFIRARSLDEPFVNSLGNLGVDIGVMAYVTLKAHHTFLSLPIKGTIEYHPSLLPKYRGPSAINWAIINGEASTGFTIFTPNDVLDDGEILYQMSFDILEDDSAGSLYHRALMPEGVKALVDCMEKVVLSDMKGRLQDSHLATYQSWCTRQLARIDWKLSARQIHNLVRGCDPKPGAWSTHRGKELVICKSGVKEDQFAATEAPPGQILHIGELGLTVKCGQGVIELLDYRNSAGTRRPVNDLISEGKFNLGDVFGA
ncbi:methionyl-tRNA formyltransferase [Photorhabdus sp. CRCIA-P01]|uniref:methionyl-tRNA formyltransferase n=1 Tax=Photorhabdus sp. CRCIA-P01 TaxID=2019570 RepID=UPI000E59AE79|nr:methionyl-tRNA formyltransferase [Photorhabdus sp. CRCIA-P01]